MTWTRRINQKTRGIFAIDLRTLALFRIVMALMIFTDLLHRLTDLSVFYTDGGVLTRAAVLETITESVRISVHMMSGSVWVEGSLFLIHLVCAIGLLVGFQTRWMTFLCWLFAVSLFGRNPLIERGAEAYLRFCLLWSVFLPLGARFSLDALASDPVGKEPHDVFHWGTVAVLVQHFIVYFFAGLYKLQGPAWTVKGDALYHTLMLDVMAHGPAPLLLLSPGLLTILTHATRWFECIAPWLLFSPFWTVPLRLVLLPCFWLFQFGIACTLKLAPFPGICGMALLVFIPSVFWERILPLFIDGDIERLLTQLEKRLRRILSMAGIRRPKIDLALSWWANFCAAALLALYLAWNITDYMPRRFRLPKPLMSLCLITAMDHRWNAYAPDIPRTGGWFVIPGTLKNGQVVDLNRDGSPLSWSKPPRISESFKNQCWQRYMTMLPAGRYQWKRDYGRYLCQSWNARHEGPLQLESLTVAVVAKTSLDNYLLSVHRREALFNYSCSQGLQPIERNAFGDPPVVMTSPYAP